MALLDRPLAPVEYGSGGPTTSTVVLLPGPRLSRSESSADRAAATPASELRVTTTATSAASISGDGSHR